MPSKPQTHSSRDGKKVSLHSRPPQTEEPVSASSLENGDGFEDGVEEENEPDTEEVDLNGGINILENLDEAVDDGLL